jgi:hypothetical protein
METSRENFKDGFKAILIGSLTVVMISTGIIFSHSAKDGNVLGMVSEGVNVGASVEACLLRLKVYPEKRIPPTGNWGTDLTVNIYDSNDVAYVNFTTTTDDLGFSPYIDICDLLGPPPQVGQYDLVVKGLSHLRSRYSSVTLFNQSQTSIDLTTEPPLLAGETGMISDDFINGLDLSTQVKTLYTNNNKNDLNQDGIVNSLDISNSIYNLYMQGEN